MPQKSNYNLLRKSYINDIFFLKEKYSTMVFFSLVISILKITAICSLHLSKSRFIQTAFDYAARQTHCFHILAIKVKKKEKIL